MDQYDLSVELRFELVEKKTENKFLGRYIVRFLVVSFELVEIAAS